MSESPGGSSSTAGTDLLSDLPADEPKPEPQKGRGYRALIEWTIILMAVLLCTVLLRTYVVQSFSIPSLSMYPTLKVGDRIIVNKLSYHLHGVQRGDIVVFASPPLEDQEYADLVKRVIGLPGETISAKDGHVYINGKRLNEPWLPPGAASYTGALPGDAHPQFDLPGPVKIPPGEYFVMGDNRTDSEDSRFFGPIPRSLIVGRAEFVAWPLSHIKGL
ncbi:MAG TPA: signal peptidase I [Acidimicrobiales bacterium]|nr:signal peptidase I [Acidimicrobiales bacterium]